MWDSFINVTVFTFTSFPVYVASRASYSPFFMCFTDNFPIGSSPTCASTVMCIVIWDWGNIYFLSFEVCNNSHHQDSSFHIYNPVN